MTCKRVCVVVLGDFERSPRMKYHCLSFTKLDYFVDVIAYSETKVSDDILNNQLFKLHPIESYSSLSSSFPRLIGYFLKTAIQSLMLLYTLFSLEKPDFLLLQNPPSIPTIPIIWFYSIIRGIKFIIDWHNYGHTILALSLHSNHPLVRICRWCEGFFGSKAYHNFCVSQSMANDLKRTWKIKADVFYDRPTEIFAPMQPEDRREFLLKMATKFPQFRAKEANKSKFYETASSGDIVTRKSRPFILISSTSWTEDEDFSVLLSALDNYDSQLSTDRAPLPELICVITGKGPLKSYYEEILSKKKWKKVTTILPWLESEDYPKMVAAADIGVCLHTSSSGLDLPMKIIDMFGCCVPVLAIHYRCLNELIKDGVNGKTFKDSTELANSLRNLLLPPRSKLSNMRDHLNAARNKFSWENEWNRKVRPVFHDPSN